MIDMQMVAIATLALALRENLKKIFKIQFNHYVENLTNIDCNTVVQIGIQNLYHLLLYGFEKIDHQMWCPLRASFIAHFHKQPLSSSSSSALGWRVTSSSNGSRSIVTHWSAMNLQNIIHLHNLYSLLKYKQVKETSLIFRGSLFFLRQMAQNIVITIFISKL